MLSPEQSQASEPTSNVVVQANAGTGKTFVLVQRLLRILFREFQEKTEGAGNAGKSDAPPGILCLTYTNAGASEMRNRVLGAVSEWAVADDAELRGLLSGIAHNNPPSDADLRSARGIFYDFIDNPHLLKIQTIHSFCEDILRRFPVEAEVPPAWRLVSGAEQKRLLKESFSEMLNRAGQDEEKAFGHVLGLTSEYSLDALLDSILEQYRHIILLKQKINFPDYIIEKTKDFLSIGKPPMKPDFDGDFGLILTKTGDIRKKLPPELQKVANEVYEYDQYARNAEIMRLSADFLTLCGAFADKYIGLKNQRGLLDFDDILHKTMILFSNPKTMGYVLSRLDMNIKHILVDESQDNSPVMWQIIFSMLDDFFVNGEKANPHSLFIVGDIKQSIFSFQGASPSDFASVPEKIRGIAGGGKRQYETVPLLESRRATQAILDVVDYFFNAAALPGFPEKVGHKCWRKGDAGLVEMHQVFSKNGDEELAAARKKYVGTIADKIESLIRNENIPQSDIMVLVQRREPFVPMLVRELRRKGIQTAGSDRIILPAFPAIRDLLNLIRFVLRPDDRENDASLAFVLRGPVCRWTEKELYDLCADRNRERSLFATLGEKNRDTYDELSKIASLANLPPYSFFSEIMGRYRRDFIAAFGSPAIQPLDEFMTLSLSYERTRAGGLAGFLRWFLDGENEVRRDMERDAGVRILTAHSSKGLEAPVVFLIDTTRNPKSRTKQMPFSVLNPEDGVFLCKAGDVDSEKYKTAKEIELGGRVSEYWRLFYVALTRARDRLYVFGCDDGTRNENWHSKLYEIIKGMPGARVLDDGTIAVSNPQTNPSKPAEKIAEKAEPAPLILPGNQLKELDFSKNIVKTPISDIIGNFSQKYGVRYGTDVHKKLQFLSLGDDGELAERIRQNPALSKFWEAGGRAEVPIAGTIGGRFCSFRVDRMIETDDSVEFLDYKTDSTRARRDEYVEKLKKYAALLSRIYPSKSIRAHILWLHDWQLDEAEL